MPINNNNKKKTQWKRSKVLLQQGNAVIFLHVAFVPKTKKKKNSLSELLPGGTSESHFQKGSVFNNLLWYLTMHKLHFSLTCTGVS